ncbi:MAG TPA: sigma-70 family RNA polymerase sigma factor [Candidatus Angelobacter sp.]|nr:sigma-70 family RNA polymerase sigma factor [Candidatus Angelobacter sp.]
MTPNPQGDAFPLTRHSVVAAAQGHNTQERVRAMDAITNSYWRPVYKYVRLRWRLEREDAEDFTQDFFRRLLEKDFLASYDPAKGKLRTFLRTCIDRLFMNQLRDSRRQKRGDAAIHVSLDFEEAEHELAASIQTGSSEDYFEKEWVRTLFALAVERLRAHCQLAGKTTQFALFERYDLGDADDDARPSYAALAEEFHIAATDVTNYLAFVRREFRRAVLAQLRDMTGSDEEFQREARSLLGVEQK